MPRRSVFWPYQVSISSTRIPWSSWAMIPSGCSGKSHPRSDAADIELWVAA